VQLSRSGHSLLSRVEGLETLSPLAAGVNLKMAKTVVVVVCSKVYGALLLPSHVVLGICHTRFCGECYI
jgi:hypothetical protein